MSLADQDPTPISNPFQTPNMVVYGWGPVNGHFPLNRHWNKMTLFGGDYGRFRVTYPSKKGVFTPKMG